jgi:hypothetical protein
MTSATVERHGDSVLGKGAPIHVVATTLEGTRGALAAATALARAMDSRVYVIAQTGVPRSVPGAPATIAAQALADDIRQLSEASSESVVVIAMLGRQPTDVIPLLPPRALVFIGGTSGRWWPSAAQRVAHAFTRFGCRVVFVHASPAGMASRTITDS